MGLTACAGIKQPIKNIGKSDIDLVSDIHIQMIRSHVEQLTLRLYEMNPDELGKFPSISIENRMAQILNHSTNISYKETNYKDSIAAIELAFDYNYRGDRVFALLLGISSMLKFSYNNLDELFLFNTLDPQKLYDSARNLEKIALKLRTQTYRGKTLIKLGATHGPRSFEDAMSRLISIQDMMAEIIVAKTQRIINKTVYSATTLFIPIGL